MVSLRNADRHRIATVRITAVAIQRYYTAFINGHVEGRRNGLEISGSSG